jgi:hypothetical protein
MRIGGMTSALHSLEREKTLITMFLAVFATMLIVLGVYGISSINGVISSRADNEIGEIFGDKFEYYR